MEDPTAAHLLELAETIRPVLKFAHDTDNILKPSDVGRFYYIVPVDIFKTSFVHSPVPVGDPLLNLQVHSSKEIRFTYNYSLSFKPTIAEVLAHVTPEMAATVVAFYTESHASAYEDTHGATVTFYTRPSCTPSLELYIEELGRLVAKAKEMLAARQ